MKFILMLVVLLTVGCTASAPPPPPPPDAEAIERAAIRAAAPTPEQSPRAVPPPAALPMSVGQWFYWTMEQQTIAEAMGWEYWAYINDTEDEFLTPVTCRPFPDRPADVICRAQLPPSPAWQPGKDHRFTMTSYNPRNGLESAQSNAMMVTLTASKGPTPQDLMLEEPVLQPKPPLTKPTP